MNYNCERDANSFFDITVPWMSGHVEIICNEAAYVAAVETTLQGTLSLFVLNVDFM
jgi:hypothetical protein